MLNYKKIKELKISPDRVRALISQIEGQAIKGNAIRNEIKGNRIEMYPKNKGYYVLGLVRST